MVLPLAAGAVVKLSLGTMPALLAATFGALLGAWLVVGQSVRQATAERQAAERATESGRRRLQALAQVSVALSQQLDPNRLLRQIADTVAALTAAHNVVMWELDRASGRLERRAWTTDPSIGATELPTSLELGQGGTGWIARHQLQQVCLDLILNAEQAILGSGGVGGRRTGDCIRITIGTRREDAST